MLGEDQPVSRETRLTGLLHELIRQGNRQMGFARQNPEIFAAWSADHGIPITVTVKRDDMITPVERAEKGHLETGKPGGLPRK